MYLNQFDFLYNAVGIESAAKVYFNKSAIDLSKNEAAILVGMCKNPSLYNPFSYKNKNYATKIALKKNVAVSKVSQKEIQEAKAKDSTRSIKRRNQVLFQWLRNSENQNVSIKNKLTRKEYEKLCKEPIIVDYHSVDHKEGMAPYFRIELKKEVQSLLKSKNSDGKYTYAKKDGSPYDIYEDGLKIYTTINTSLQQKAEDALVQSSGIVACPVATAAAASTCSTVAWCAQSGHRRPQDICGACMAGVHAVRANAVRMPCVQHLVPQVSAMASPRLEPWHARRRAPWCSARASPPAGTCSICAICV